MKEDLQKEVTRRAKERIGRSLSVPEAAMRAGRALSASGMLVGLALMAGRPNAGTCPPVPGSAIVLFFGALVLAALVALRMARDLGDE